MSTEALKKKMEEALEKGALDATMQMNVDDHPPLYMISYEDRKEVTETAPNEIDTTVTVTEEDFIAMADGQLDATAAFMQGKMTIDGDMSVAMKLAAMLS